MVQQDRWVIGVSIENNISVANFDTLATGQFGCNSSFLPTAVTFRFTGIGVK